MTMSVYDFLGKINDFFPSGDKKEIVTQKINEYAGCILDYVNKQKKQYDYDKIFKQLLISYKYKTFPTLSDILEVMPYGAIIVRPNVSYSGDEGKTIKRVINGHEYEFTIVPNMWDNVMTISELDRDINRRLSNVNTGAGSF